MINIDKLSTIEKFVVETARMMEDELIELAANLVRIPSEITPDSGNESSAQHYLASFIKPHDYDLIDVFLPTDIKGIKDHPGWWAGQKYEERPNVVALRKGVGGGRSLILNGHMDTVPAGDPDKWKFGAFSGQIKDGKLYGRGACDMKSGIAVMVMAAEAIHRAGVYLKGDLILQSVVAEETGVYNGTLACCLKGYNADGAIIMEPTSLDLCRGIKGNHVYEVELDGIATHNCLWWNGKSAFDHAIYFKEGMQEFQKLRAEEQKNHSLYGDKKYFAVPALVDDIWSVQIGVPHMFSVPDSARMTFMIEILPGEDRTDIMDRFERFMLNWCQKHPFLKDNAPRFISPGFRPIFPVIVQEKHPLVECFSNMVMDLRGEPLSVRGFESACDAMTLMLWGDTPAVIYGPGQLKNAHEIDEKISVDELKQALIELSLLILRFCEVA